MYSLCALLSCVTWLLAVSRCLPGEDEQMGELRNLILPTLAEERPITVVSLEWESSQLAVEIFKIIVEEVLGFKVDTDSVTTDDGKAAIEALAGCSALRKSPLELTGVCTAGGLADPVAHIVIEAWNVFSATVDRLSFGNRPHLVGIFSYRGSSGIFFPESTLALSLQENGIGTDYYRNYDVSWFNMSRFFDSVLDVEAFIGRKGLGGPSLAEPGVLEVAEFGESYREYTQDDSIFVDPLAPELALRTIRGGWIPTAPCWDLLALDKLGSSTALELCIPLLTAGSVGWGTRRIFQWAYWFNMPLIIGVFSRDDWVAIGGALDVLVYWWFPDVTFNSKKPIIMPEANPVEHAGNLFKTGSAVVQLEKVAWAAMDEASPEVAHVLEHFDLTSSEMFDLIYRLSTSLNGTQSFEAGKEELQKRKEVINVVACAWLQDNPKRWREWLPVEGSCAKDERTVFRDPACPEHNSTEPLEHCNFDCLKCNVGEYSLMNPVTGVRVCKLCPAGFYCFGGNEPVQCPTGSKCPVGSDVAIQCPLGTYQNKRGQSVCYDCPYEGMSTMFLAARSMYDCSCKADFYRKCATPDCTVASELTAAAQNGLTPGVIDIQTGKIYERKGGFCKFCGKHSGLECPGGHYVIPGYTYGQMRPPRLKPQFMSLVNDTFNTDSLLIYKCRGVEQCPGGVLGTCGEGMKRAVPACGKCEDGHFNSGEKCYPCNQPNLATRIVWPIFCLGVFFGILMMIYWFANDPLTAKISVSLMCAMSMGMMFLVVQSVAVLNRIDARWPIELQGFLGSLQIFFFDLSDSGFLCAMIVGPVEDYAMRTFIPLLVLIVYAALAVLNKITRRKIFSVSKLTSIMTCAFRLINSAGAVYQACYITLVLNSVAPLQCYTHPSGESSVVLYPAVICGSETHRILVALSIFSILVYSVGFLAACVYICFTAPRLTSCNAKNVVRFRFLFYRFRPDRWYDLIFFFSCVFLYEASRVLEGNETPCRRLLSRYWSVVILLRNGLLALAPVLAPDEPHMQLVAMSVVIMLGLALQATMWPWNSTALNHAEAVTSSGLVIIITASSAFIPTRGTSEEAEKYQKVIFIVFGFILVTLGMVALRGVGKMYKKSREKMNKEAEAASKHKQEVLSLRWFNMANAMASWTEKQRCLYLESLTEFDRGILHKAMGTLTNVGISVKDLGTTHAKPWVNRARFRAHRITVDRRLGTTFKDFTLSHSLPSSHLDLNRALESMGGHSAPNLGVSLPQESREDSGKDEDSSELLSMIVPRAFTVGCMEDFALVDEEEPPREEPDGLKKKKDRASAVEELVKDDELHV